MTHTADSLALLKAILANPDDDTARLVYADCIQEQGDDARAEFIRVQVELARVSPVVGWEVGSEECYQCICARGGRQRTNGPCRCTSKVRELRRRERALSTTLSPDRHNSNGVYWLGPDFPFRQGPNGRDDPTFRRGFIESVTCPAADWLAHADAIRAAHPIRTVTLTTLPQPTRIVYRGDYFTFPDDPAAEWLSTRDVVAARTAEEVASGADFHISAMCRLRWPGIAFELPT